MKNWSSQFKGRISLLFKKIPVFLRLAACFIAFFVLSAATYAQQSTVSGTVIDAATAEALPGVNISIKGTTIGVVTDIDGKYTIQIPGPGAVLQFTSVGYLTEMVTVGEQTVIDVKLSSDITSLDEVVVIGYGVLKKKLSTGATAQIKGESLEKLNTFSPLQALQGQTSGVNITSTSGQPGEDMKITIRGLGTISGAKPLYIVDGIQTDDIKYLNNADIESIDVLKDAASAAIYGSRAANGVVLVTTRQGKAGKSQVTFDAYYGLQNRAKKISMLNSSQYATIMNEQQLNSGGLPSSVPFDVSDLPAYTSNGVANTDWVNEMFVSNAPMQNYSLGVTGGNEQTVYALSLAYTQKAGIAGGVDVSDYERYSGRINTESNLYNKKLKIGEHVSFAYTNKKGIQVGNQYGNTLRGAFNTSPLLPMYDDNGNYFNSNSSTIVDQNGDYYWNSGESNPYALMMLTNQNLTCNQKLLADVFAELEIIKDLKLRSTFSIDYFSSQYRSFTPIYELSAYSFSTYTSATQSMSKTLSLNTDNVLSYALSLGGHKIDAMAGVSTHSYGGSYMSGTNTILAFNDFEHAYLSNATNSTNASQKVLAGYPYDDDKLLSYFGRLQYNFNETYMFNATLRADGSSKFAKNNRWGYFPSFSAGWVISNESFMESTSSYLDFLKLRASWGQNGNQAIDAFQYLAPIKFTQATYNFGNVEGTNATGSYPSRLAYDKLKWETSEQINIGFDTRFLNNHLSATIDLFKKTTKDWLLIAPILGTVGTGAPYVNGGNVNNTGIELGLTYENKWGDLNYSVSANGSYIKNEVTEIPTSDGIIHGASNSLYNNSTEFYRAEKGHPIGYFWGYQTNGLFQNTSEVNSYTSSDGTVIQPKAEPGDIRYVDQNKDGSIDDDDKIEIGDPNPDFTFGLSFSCDYKALDFSVVANGVAGNQIVQSYRNHASKYANYTSDIWGRWTGEGTSNRIPRVTNSNINYQFSDLFVQDGDYLRISNVTLGFDVAKLVSIKNFSQCRLYASVQNLYTFTNYTGMDPEVGYGLDNGATDRFSSGIDLGFYPNPRTVLFGISLKF
jgi:TonB-dependent starch-binding outer membrane protein SusC